jgi:hypothetical protein
MRLPFDSDWPRKGLFWLSTLAASAGTLPTLHWRDTSHGDRWDWFDWAEATIGSVCFGLVIVCALWWLVIGSRRS